MEQTATIFDIGRFRNEDGPGIRTILFFKGCPLRCLWCSNPFGLSAKPQLAWRQERCTGCGACVTNCKRKVNELREGKLLVNFAACEACGDCVEPCPTEARLLTGTVYTAQELYREVAKDAAFYRKHSGGVTLSGGEVLLQHELAAEVLRLCKRNYINTCIETSAFGTWEQLLSLAQYCDYVFVDLKQMDSVLHERYTGVSNEGILQNIRALCDYAEGRDCQVIVRVPLIPGYTDGEENLRASARFVASLSGSPPMNLLPYHSMGENKYAMLGEAYTLSTQGILRESDPRMQRALALCRDEAPNCRISIGGGEIAL